MLQRRLPALTAERTARFTPDSAVVRLEPDWPPRPKRAADMRRVVVVLEEDELPPMLRIHGGRTSAWASEGEDGGFGERESALAADS